MLDFFKNYSIDSDDIENKCQGMSASETQNWYYGRRVKKEFFRIAQQNEAGGIQKVSSALIKRREEIREAYGADSAFSKIFADELNKLHKNLNKINGKIKTATTTRNTKDRVGG